MRVLIVRAAEDARRTAARLAGAGHEAIIAPVLTIQPLDFTLPDGVLDAVVATSAHAFTRAEPLQAICAAPLYAVGARTAEAARTCAFAAPQTIAPNAEALAQAAGPALAGKRVLYLAGRDRKPDLEAALAPICALLIVETYAAEPAQALAAAAAEALTRGGAAVLHYSQRSAAIFLDLAARAGLAAKIRGSRHVAISRDAASPLIASGFHVAIAALPNEDSMIAELARIEAGVDRAGSR